ncbi:MAG: hypothetical protein ABEJ58_06835 [Halodesulfurarchaeum sp.]
MGERMRTPGQDRPPSPPPPPPDGRLLGQPARTTVGTVPGTSGNQEGDTDQFVQVFQGRRIGGTGGRFDT